MRFRSAAFVLLLCLAPTAVHADVLVNDRSDPVGPAQVMPRVTTVFNNNTIGTMVVTLWSVFPNAAGFRFAVAPINTLAFTQGGTPPVPAGFQWLLDPVVRGAANDEDGFFYVGGSVRLPGLPLTTGLAFVRGRVDVPGSVSFDPPRMLASYGTASANIGFYDATAMEVHPADGMIYVLYLPQIGGGPRRNFYFVRSGDSGTSWSSPVRVSTDSLVDMLCPSIAFGVNPGDVTFFWQRPNGTQMDVWSRHSTNSGATMTAPAVMMTFPRTGGASPSFGGEFEPAATVDRWGLLPGSLIYGATIPLDVDHDTFPDVATAPAISEFEVNGAPASATPVWPSGVVVRGTIAAAADTDCFGFDLAQGEEVNVDGDSLSGSTATLQLDWLGLDGKSVLTSQFVGPGAQQSRLGFVAPVGARYTLRVTGPIGGYRLRTVWGTAPYPGASDQRDVAFSRLPSGGGWTGTQLVAPADPIGYDATSLALAPALDGAVYATFTDFAVAPGRAFSRRVIRRSANSGASWSEAVPISSANTDWSLTSAGFGGADMSASDGINLLTVWTDGRNGDPDVYLDRIERRVYVTSVDPFTATAHPGETVHAVRNVRNADHAESFGVTMIPDGSGYGWTLPTSAATLAPGATAPLDCTFQVPIIVAPGDYTIPVFYRSADAPSGATYGIAPLALHVLGSTDVDGTGPAVMALAPVRPNPLTGPCDVHFSLSRAGRVKLAIYGIDGRVVRSLVDGERAAGGQAVAWDGRDESGSRAAPGEYFVVLKAEGHTLTRRIVELR